MTSCGESENIQENRIPEPERLLGYSSPSLVTQRADDQPRRPDGLALQMLIDTLSIVAGLVALLGMGVQAWLWKQAYSCGMACPDS